MPFFSIITPCYNSSKTLEATFDSLRGQTHTDFEWILVDDASTDGGATVALIERLSASAPFPVKRRYLEQNHFGSKSVHTASLMAEGEYAVILDHDDRLTPDALSLVRQNLEEFGDNPRIAGVVGRCVDEFDRFIGKRFAADCAVANEGEIRFKQGVTSELLQFTRLDLVRQHFAAMQPGYTNGFVWAEISRQFDFIYINDVVRIYDVGLPTSYSNNPVMIVRYPNAKAAALRSTISAYRNFLRYNPRYSCQLIGSYLRHTINGGTRFIHAVSGFDLVLKAWCVLMYPAAALKARGLLG